MCNKNTNVHRRKNYVRYQQNETYRTFAGGVLFGTAGVKVLASKDAKKLYINCLAAGLRAKESVMTTATNIQENAGDILAEAKEINRVRAEEAAKAADPEVEETVEEQVEE